MSNMIQVGAGNFDQVIATLNVPVMMYFWEEWAAPCRILDIQMEELATAYKGQVTIGRIKGEPNQDVLDMIGVRNIPTVVYYQNGQEVDRIEGAAPKNVYESKLTALIG